MSIGYPTIAWVVAGAGLLPAQGASQRQELPGLRR